MESPIEAELPTGPEGDLVRCLRDLHNDAGRLSLRRLSHLIRVRDDLPDTVSHDTINAMLRGDRLPNWPKLQCLVTVLVERSVRRPDLKATLERFHGLWAAATQSTSDGGPHKDQRPSVASRESDSESEHEPLTRLVRAHTLERRGEPVALPPLTATTGPVWAVAFSRDGRWLASGEEAVRIWSASTGQLAFSLPGHTEIVWGLAFSPNSRELATASHDRTVRLWDLATAKSTAILTNHTHAVWGVAYSPDGRWFATASEDGTAVLRHIASCSARVLAGHTGAAYQVAFSPDSRLLATASDDRSVRLWDVADGQPVGRPLLAHTDRVNEVAFSPDGRQLATASADHTAVIWNLADRRPSRALVGHVGTVEGVAFSPDGRRLATTSHDGTIRLWDPQTGHPSGRPLSGHGGMVYRAAFSPDGHLLATGGRDETVRLWAFR